MYKTTVIRIKGHMMYKFCMIVRETSGNCHQELGEGGHYYPCIQYLLYYTECFKLQKYLKLVYAHILCLANILVIKLQYTWLSTPFFTCKRFCIVLN